MRMCATFWLISFFGRICKVPDRNVDASEKSSNFTSNPADASPLDKLRPSPGHVGFVLQTEVNPTAQTLHAGPATEKQNDLLHGKQSQNSSQSASRDGKSKQPFIDGDDHHSYIASSDAESRQPITEKQHRFKSPVLNITSAVSHSIHSNDTRNARSAMGQTAFQSRLRMLNKKRFALLQLRVEVQEARSSLQQKRSSLADRNAQVLQDLQRRSTLSVPTSPSMLSDLLVDHQKVLEELQVEEVDFNVVEDQLTRGEWELWRAEKNIYETSERLRTDPLAAEDASDSDVEIVEVASNSTIDARPSGSPLEEQLQSRIGYVRILEEQLCDLRADRAHFVEDNRARQALGVQVGQESKEFLTNFDARHNQLQQDLYLAEEDVRRQRKAVAMHSVVSFSTSQFDGPESEEGGKIESSPPDPLLLPSDDRTPVFFNVEPKIDQQSVSPTNLVNSWLLHRLCRSSLEVQRLRSAIELEDVRLDGEQFRDLVLEWWWRDETVDRPLQGRSHSAGSLSQNIDLIDSARTTKHDSVFPVPTRLRRLHQSGDGGSMIVDRKFYNNTRPRSSISV